MKENNTYMDLFSRVQKEIQPQVIIVFQKYEKEKKKCLKNKGKIDMSNYEFLLSDILFGSSIGEKYDVLFKGVLLQPFGFKFTIEENLYEYTVIPDDVGYICMFIEAEMPEKA